MSTNIRTILLAVCFSLGAIVAYGQTITTIAGNGSGVFSGDGVQATATAINVPSSVCIDASGNLYIADYGNNRVRKVDPTGIIATVAGTGAAGFGGDGFAATSATLHSPIGVCVDASGNLYIADNLNNRIRKVNTSGIITTYAGNGSPGSGGDGSPATLASLSSPARICIDGAGNLYIPDFANNRVRKVNTSGIITNFAGNGTAGSGGDGTPATAAQLHSPSAVAVDASGNVFITEFAGNKVRMVNTAGTISTFAGTGATGSTGDTGPATAAKFNSPNGICIDASGNIYVSDYGNQRVRKISIAGIITAFAGNGTPGFIGDGFGAATAELHSPSGITTDGNCNLFIADNANNRVRQVTLSAPPVTGVITGPSEVCVAGTILLFDAVTGGAWSSSAPGIAAVGGAGNVTGMSGGTAVISYTTSNGCNLASATRTVTVDASVNAGIITGSFSVCQGASTLLNDAATGGTWSSGATGIATIGSTGSLTGISPGNAVISYSLTNACGTDVTTQLITINPLPNAGTVTGSVTVCPGTGAPYSDASPGGVWHSSASGIATVGGTGMVTGVAAGTATISYTVTNGCGTATATRIVTVLPLPNAGTLTGLATVCVAASTGYTPSVSGGTWSSSAVATATVGSTGIVTGVAAGAALISYSVTNVCGTAVATKPVTVLALANAGTITGTLSVCAGLTDTLHDVAPGGTWSSSVPGIAVVGSTGIVTAFAGGTATISYTVSNGCGANAATRVFTVNPQPNHGAITGPSTVCIGIFVPFTDSSPGGIWSVTNSNAIILSSGDVYGIAGGIDTVKYAVTNGCGTAVATAAITVTPHPAAGTISGLAAVCAGAAATLSDGVAGGTWSAANGTATVSAAGLVTAISAGIDTIMYSVANSCGTDIATHIVTIDPLPHAAVIAGPDTICKGNIITLTDSTGGGSWLTGNGNAFVSSTGAVFGITAGTDVISYISANTCGSDTATKAIEITNCTTAVNDISGTAMHIAISPDPTSGPFTVQSPVNAILDIYTPEGKKIATYNITRGATALDLPAGIAAGMYLCRFNGSDGSIATVRMVYKR